MMIHWPPKFEPSRAPVSVGNHLDLAASREVAWAWLVRAELWPTWYPNAHEVRIAAGGGPDLALGTRFRWRTFGVSLESRVEEFVPEARIAWRARGFGVEAYHAWLLEKTADGCHVLTEETQYGLLARLQQLFLPNRMHYYHQIWLERLAAQAAGGPPAETSG